MDFGADETAAAAGEAFTWAAGDDDETVFGPAGVETVVVFEEEDEDEELLFEEEEDEEEPLFEETPLPGIAAISHEVYPRHLTTVVEKRKDLTERSCAPLPSWSDELGEET